MFQPNELVAGDRLPRPDPEAIFFDRLAAWRSPLCVADAEEPDMPLIFVNDAFCALTGYKSNEVIGRNCRFLQGKATDELWIRRLSEAVAARRDVNAHLVNYRKDGSQFENLLTINFVEIGDGRCVAVGSQYEIPRKQASMLSDIRLADDRMVMSEACRHSLDAATQTFEAMSMRTKATTMIVRSYAQSSRRRSANGSVDGVRGFWR